MIEFLGPEHLRAMLIIIERCRKIMGLRAELNWSMDMLQDSLARGKALGYFDDGRLVSFVLFVELQAAEATHSLNEIWCLATDPSHQGRGLMARLLSHLQNQYQEIWLEVHEDNSVALAFYKGKGFQLVGQRRRYYTDGGAALQFSWVREKH
jgi:ribosomal protein S18 acetylase RimI-like enzyme